jgi:peptidoglycan/LPS O-acetylase OafA/YrhL
MGWLIGLAVPLLIAYWLRRRDAWLNVIAAVWVLVAATLPSHAATNESLLRFAWRQVGPYIWCAVAALGLVAWGLRESRRERINLGVIGFGLTVIVFYFSEVMDKLGRSASLIGMGLLFLVLGWVLEKTRRQLVAKVRGAAA